MKTAKVKIPKGKISKTEEVSLDRREADFTVLMLGARRTGKSSMLSSMINSMDRLCAETGFRFAASEATKTLMNTKQSQLQNIFHAFLGQEEFCTQEGIYDDIVFSEATYDDIGYRFVLELAETGEKSAKKSKKNIIIDFVDSMGESLTENPADGGNRSIGDWISQSAVILIAIDAPALMEGRNSKNSFGTFHEAVNLPDLIYNHIANADSDMRSALQEGQQLSPKLILFVPLKCEKYYYDKTPLMSINDLRECVREGYRNLFTFFKSRTEYTVAITPILTLGDVVFDHYKTRTIKLANGMERQIPIMYGEDREDLTAASMCDIPRYPMFHFRNEQPSFSPRYCEQPLLYLLAYICCVTELIAKKEKKKGTLLKKTAFWSTIFILGGAVGVLGVKGAQLLMKALTDDPAMNRALQKVTENIKFDQEDGYDLVYDNLGLRKEFELC